MNRRSLNFEDFRKKLGLLGAHNAVGSRLHEWGMWVLKQREMRRMLALEESNESVGVNNN